MTANTRSRCVSPATVAQPKENQPCLGMTGNDARAPEGRCRPNAEGKLHPLEDSRSASPGTTLFIEVSPVELSGSG